MSETNQELMDKVVDFLSANQRYVFVNRGKQTIIRGSWRSGKSTLCAAIMLHSALKEKCAIVCASKDKDTAKNKEMTTFIALCEKIGVAYSMKDGEVYLLNGSVVLFKGVDESIDGINISLAVFPDVNLADNFEDIKSLNMPIVIAGDYYHGDDFRYFDIG